MKKQAQRQLTQVAISAGFLQLLAQEDFKLITVDQICREAQVGRSTFYKYYQDKWQLMAAILEVELQWFTDELSTRFADGNLLSVPNLTAIVETLLARGPRLQRAVASLR